MFAVFLILLKLLTTYGMPTQQFFVTEPSNTTSVAGSSVILECKVDKKQGACQWTKDGLGLGEDIRLPAYPRLSMSEDTCDLYIFPLLPEDEGVYQCQVGAKEGVQPIVSQAAQLTVTSEPGHPHITQAALGDLIEVKIGEEVNLECQSFGGKPAAHLVWKDELGNNIEDDVTRETVLMEDGKMFKSTSTLRFTPESSMEITCAAYSSEFPEAKTSVISIKQLKKPKVYLSLEKPRIIAGDSFDIICHSQAYPESVSYRWYINGQQLFNEESRKLSITNISKYFNQARVSCKVRNTVGETESSVILDVEYGPEIIEEPKNVFAAPGELVSFTCLADSNPKPTYVWMKKTTNEVVGFSSKLTVAASEQNEEYFCKVFSEGFDPVEANFARLEVSKAPTIEAVEEGEIGGDFILHCSALSNAKHTQISWSLNDRPIDISDKDYEIIYNQDGKLHHSFLVFKNQERKSLPHVCSVSNEVGTDVRISLKESKDLNYVTIVALFILFLFFFISFTLAFIIYKRRVDESVEKMENEKKLQVPTSEEAPFLERSILLNESLISPSSSFSSCNTMNTTVGTFGRSFSLDHSRTGRRVGF